MGTLVTIHVVREGAGSAIERAFHWFHEIEAHCTRFQAESELMQLSLHPRTACSLFSPRLASQPAPGSRLLQALATS